MQDNPSGKKEKQIEDDQIDSSYKNVKNFNADQSNKNNEKNL